MSFADEAELVTLLGQVRTIVSNLHGFRSTPLTIEQVFNRLHKPGGLDIDLYFRVEQWDAHDNFLRVIAASAHLTVALAAWKAAVEASPNSVWVLRHGAQVHQRHMPGVTDVADRNRPLTSI